MTKFSQSSGPPLGDYVGRHVTSLREVLSSLWGSGGWAVVPPGLWTPSECTASGSTPDRPGASGVYTRGTTSRPTASHPPYSHSPGTWSGEVRGGPVFRNFGKFVKFREISQKNLPRGGVFRVFGGQIWGPGGPWEALGGSEMVKFHVFPENPRKPRKPPKTPKFEAKMGGPGGSKLGPRRPVSDHPTGGGYPP